MATSKNDPDRGGARRRPPLYPDADVVASFGEAIAGHRDRVLLLGDTPELTSLGNQTVSTEKSTWLELPFAKESFTAAIGDGAANLLTYPEDLRAFFAETARVLVSGGVLALRVFARPEYPEAIGEIHEHVMRRGIASFDAFVLRLAMAVVSREDNPNIAASVIRENFDRMFYDRHALAAATGWSMEDIAAIDAYKNSADNYAFPTMGQLKSAIPDTFRAIRTMDSGSYELADRCPLLVMERV